MYTEHIKSIIHSKVSLENVARIEHGVPQGSRLDSLLFTMQIQVTMCSIVCASKDSIRAHRDEIHPRRGRLKITGILHWPINKHSWFLRRSVIVNYPLMGKGFLARTAVSGLSLMWLCKLISGWRNPDRFLWIPSALIIIRLKWRIVKSLRFVVAILLVTIFEYFMRLSLTWCFGWFF